MDYFQMFYTWVGHHLLLVLPVVIVGWMLFRLSLISFVTHLSDEEHHLDHGPAHYLFWAFVTVVLFLVSLVLSVIFLILLI